MIGVSGARTAGAFLLLTTCLGYGVAGAQTEADRRLAVEHGLDGQLETDRFAVFWSEDEAFLDQVRDLVQVLDGYHAEITSIVGPERKPDRRIVVLLAGPGQAPDGTWRFPHVDRAGRVFLYRYSPGFGAYAVEAAHELVHAFRRASGLWHSGFWEEGFAETVAMAADPGDVGFPRYGYPLTVTAGHLLAWDEYLPLNEVRTRHRELGRRCQLQSYLERAAFFAYLMELEGIEAIVELAYQRSNPGDDDYVRVYGRPFSELVADWEAKLLSDYQATPGADEMARRYREEPPIAGRPMCPAS